MLCKNVFKIILNSLRVFTINYIKPIRKALSNYNEIYNGLHMIINRQECIKLLKTKRKCSQNFTQWFPDLSHELGKGIAEKTEDLGFFPTHS